MRADEILNELFDQPVSWKWISGTRFKGPGIDVKIDLGAEFAVRNIDGVDYRYFVSFDKLNFPMTKTNIVFGCVNEQSGLHFEPIHTKTAFKVYSTVAAIILEFMSQHPDVVIYHLSGYEEKQTNLYRIMASRLRHLLPGWQFSNDVDGLVIHKGELEESKDELVLPTIEVGDEVLVGKFKNRKAIVKGFATDDHNQPVLKTNKGDQKLFKPRLKKLMTEEIERLEATPENIAKAREFAMAKWKERAAERASPEPADLSYSCKFTSLFAQSLFGGKIRGNWHHQYLVLDDGKTVDLNIDSADVKALGDKAHAHDPSFFRGNDDWKDSMRSIRPRVMKWVKEFKSGLSESVLVEGLIAIPHAMENAIKRVLIKHVLWWARDQFKGKTTAFPAQYKALKELIKERGVILPKEAYTKDKIIGFYIPLDFTGMPESYLKNVPTDENIKFAIIWDAHNTIGGASMLGGWMKTKKILAIKPLAIPYLQNYPRAHPDDLRLAIESMLEAVQHELRHMVQTMLLADHPEQSRTYHKKAGDDAYYSSPIEFDPQIGTAVHQFIDAWSEYPTKDLGRSLRQFTGMIPSKSHEMYSVTDFFAALRKNAPQRYKIAVKKFVAGVQASITAK